MELNFNEAFFDGRDQFLDYLRRMIGFYQAGNVTTSSMVKRLILSMAKPQEYHFDVNYSIRFAFSRGVRHLELDFYDPRREPGHVIDLAQGFRLPDVVYHHHHNLHSLKLIWCNFNVRGLNNFNSLESLTLGWITIPTQDLRELMASCPILNTLRLQFCTVVNALEIVLPGNCTLKNLVVENCNVCLDLFTLVGPELRRFVYTGKVARFRMGNQQQLIESRLDFGDQLEFETGTLLCELLEQLVNVRIMSVCSVFLQMIAARHTNNPRQCRKPYRTDSDLNVQHLTLNTELHVNELIGIKFMLASCPGMNTLDLYLCTGKIFSNYKSPYKITSPASFWREPVGPETCLMLSLLVLNVHGFRGRDNEMMFINYIVRCDHSLRSLNLYLPKGFDRNLMEFVQEKASQLCEASPGGLEISVLTPSVLVNRIVSRPH